MPSWAATAAMTMPSPRKVTNDTQLIKAKTSQQSRSPPGHALGACGAWKWKRLDCKGETGMEHNLSTGK